MPDNPTYQDQPTPPSRPVVKLRISAYLEGEGSAAWGTLSVSSVIDLGTVDFVQMARIFEALSTWTDDIKNQLITSLPDGLPDRAGGVS